MIKLEDQVEKISAKFEEQGIKADISVGKEGLMRNKYLQVIVDDINKCNDIETSATIQRTLRNVLGYGTSEISMNTGDNSLTIKYNLLKKEGLVTSVTTLLKKPSRKIQECMTPSSSYQRTPGSTHYNK